MNDRSFSPSRDPFSTLLTLTSAALTGPIRSAKPHAGAAVGEAPRHLSFLDRLVERLDHWFWRARQRELERALASATDLADVEARLQARERRLLQRYY